MTVTLPFGQLTVILAVGLTCWPYLFSVVCLIISGKEDLICVCKVDRWPSGKRNKGHSSSTVFLSRHSKYAKSSSGNFRVEGKGKKCPVGLKKSFLLLLPITPQSPALSTCKMTLDMPVLMVFYTWRLCISLMRPEGIRGPFCSPLKSSSGSTEAKLNYFNKKSTVFFCLWEEVLTLVGGFFYTFVCGLAWVWSWCVNEGTVPVSTTAFAWQQKWVDGTSASAMGDSDTASTHLCLWDSHCDHSLLKQGPLRADTARGGRRHSYLMLGLFRHSTVLWLTSYTPHPVSDRKWTDSFNFQ